MSLWVVTALALLFVSICTVGLGLMLFALWAVHVAWSWATAYIQDLNEEIEFDQMIERSELN